MASIEPKSIIPFISSEEGLVTKFTVILEKPVPLQDVIDLCGTGKGKRLTNEPSEGGTPNQMLISAVHAQLDRIKASLEIYDRPSFLEGVHRRLTNGNE